MPVFGAAARTTPSASREPGACRPPSSPSSTCSACRRSRSIPPACRCGFMLQHFFCRRTSFTATETTGGVVRAASSSTSSCSRWSARFASLRPARLAPSGSIAARSIRTHSAAKLRLTYQLSGAMLCTSVGCSRLTAFDFHVAVASINRQCWGSPSRSDPPRAHLGRTGRSSCHQI